MGLRADWASEQISTNLLQTDDSFLELKGHMRSTKDEAELR